MFTTLCTTMNERYTNDLRPAVTQHRLDQETVDRWWHQLTSHPGLTELLTTPVQPVTGHDRVVGFLDVTTLRHVTDALYAFSDHDEPLVRATYCLPDLTVTVVQCPAAKAVELDRYDRPQNRTGRYDLLVVLTANET